MNIKNLEKCFYEASLNGAKYVGIKIKMEGFPKAEIIVNENEKFSEIKIVGFAYGDSFSEIEQDLLG